MRKSFTRFLGLLTLFVVLGFQVSLAGVKTLVPKDGETDAVKTTDLTLTFDNPVSKGTAFNTAAIQLKTSGGDLVDQINASDVARFTFSADMKTITLDVQALLIEGNSYYVYFPSDVLKENMPDGSTPSFAGYSQPTDWNFTVGDHSNPVLATASNYSSVAQSPLTYTPAKPFYPVSGQTDVGSTVSTVNGAFTSKFYVTFNESVKGNVGYIKIYEKATGEIHEIINANGINATANSLVSFETTKLRPATEYYILIDAGAFIDGSKNAFAGITSTTAWTFKTRSTSAPTITASVISSSLTETAFNVSAAMNLNGVFSYAVTTTVTDTPVYTSSVTVTNSNPITIVNSGLTAGTKYYFYYKEEANGALRYFDLVTNAKVADATGISSKDKLTVTTPDTTLPDLRVYVGGSNNGKKVLFPVSGSVGVPADLSGTDDGPTLTMSFTEEVKAGAGNIIVYNAADNTVFESIDVTNTNQVVFAAASVAITDVATPCWTAKIKLTNKLQSTKSYYIKLANGVIVDKASNKFAGFTVNTAWTFTAGDNVAPTVTWSTPTTADKGLLQAGSTVSLTFNETLSSTTTVSSVVVEKDNVIQTGTGGTDTFTVTLTTNSYGPIGYTVTGSWKQNSNYVIKVLANTVCDVSGNYITKELHKAYSTDSWVVPTSSFDPDPATGSPIATDKSIKVKFTENIALLGGTEITNANIASLFTVRENGGPLVSFTATWNYSATDGYYALITPTAPWTTGKSYTVSVSADYQDMNLKDGANSPLTIQTASYDVKDTTAPTVSFEIKPSATVVDFTSPDLKILFSETLTNTTTDAAVANAVILRVGSATGEVVGFTVSQTAILQDYKIIPTSPLKAGTTYYLAVADKAVADASGNKNVGNSTTFVTGAAPEVVSVTPANESTNVVASTTNSISLTFSEAVKAGSVSPTSTTALTLYTWDGSTWTPTGTTTAISQITFVGNSATFPYTIGSLNSETTYSFSVVAGAVQDVDGNKSDAIEAGDYSFTTKDVTPPVVSALGVPATNTTTSDDNLGKEVSITFNEKVNRGSGTITIVGTTASSTFSQSIDVNGTLVSISDDQKVVTVAHNRFAPANNYTIQFNAGSFKDLAGNKAGTWSQTFTTNANQGPNFVAAQSFPLNGADKLALNSDLVIKFDENITIADGNKRVTLLKYVSGSGSWVVAQSYRMNETNVSVSGNQINVSLVDLADDSQYGVFLEAGTVSDVVSGTNVNAAIGTSSSTPWIFYTGDHNGPVATFTVAGTLDTDKNLKKVDRTANIVITFDEAIQLVGGTAVTSANIVDEAYIAPVNGGNVVKLALGAPTGSTVSGTHMEASIDASKKVITIPAASIIGYGDATNTQYTVYVGNVQDVLGHLGSTQSLTFWIDDYTAPVTTATITANTEGTQVVLSVKSDEKANAYYYLVANGTATPTAAAVKANGKLLAIPDETEASEVTIATSPETKYDLYVAAEDLGRITLQSNATVEASKMTILTADLTAPVVTTYGNNGKTDINVSGGGTLTLTVTFSTDVTLDPGKKAYIYNASNNALVFSSSSITVTNDANGKPRLLNIFVPTSSLSSNSSYYVNMDKGLVTDVASTLPIPNVGTTTRTVNEYAGLFDATTYAFKTKDTVRPSIKTVTPNKADDVLGTVDGNLVVTFTESVVANSVGAGDILINEVGGSTTTPTYTTKEIVLLTNSATTSLDGAVLTINPVMNLTSSKEYQVVLKQDLVKDASGNTLSPSTSFNFVVKDVSVPTVAFTASSTTKGLTKEPVLLDENLKITFSEKVVLLDGSIIEKADVDSLVSLTDAAGKALAFVSTFIDREGPAPVWVIDPKSNLKSNSTYTLSFGSIVMDVAGNKVPAQSVTFTTKLSQSPDIIFAPVNASANIDQNSNITITSSRSLYQADPTGSVALGFFSQLENSELKNYVHLGTTAVANDVAFTATIDADKKVITIDPVIALTSGMKYYLTFKPLGFASTTTSTTDGTGVNNIYPDLVDEFNNNVVVPLSITNGTATITTNQAEFTVVDYVAPTLVSVSTPDKNYLPSTDKLEITLSEEVIPGTGDIKIYRKDGTLAETIPASAMTVKSDNKKVLQINPSALSRENNMEYYVIIPEGAIVDKSSLANKFAGLLDNTKWIYKTADNLSPVVVSFLPAKGATNVGLYDNLAVYFDKDIALGNGIISIYKKDGSAFDLIRVEDGENAVVDPVDGKKLIINFARVLDQNSEYFVKIEAGVVVNKLNDKAKFAGINDATTWTFSTESTTAPKYLSLSPVDNATGVSISDPLTLKITFDADVQAGTGTVRLVNTLSGSLVESIDVSKTTISSSKREVNIPVTAALKENTLYHVFVDANAYTNTLPSKVGFAGINAYDVWNFTTAADVTAPTLTVTAPVAPIAKVFTVGLTFSEPVTGVASGVTVTNGTFVVSGAGAQYSITVTSEEQKNVTIVLANTITDLAKIPNAFAGQTLSYTVSAPVLVSSTPTGTLKDNHPSFVVTFADNVVAGTGSLKVYKKSDSTLALSIPVTVGMISGKVATVTYTYDAAKKNGLDQNTDYYVLVDKGFVKDVAGNEFAGVTASTTWTFKTGDFATITDPDVNNSLEFKVYPNPFVESVTVSNASELSKVVVSNIAGQVVKEVVYPDGTIQLNELHSGVYFIALYKDGKVVSTVKLLKR